MCSGRLVVLTVVGRAVIPPSLDLSETHRLGQGAILTGAGLRKIDPRAAAVVRARRACATNPRRPSRRCHTSLPVSGSFSAPNDRARSRATRASASTPQLLALLLGLLGVGVLAHVLDLVDPSPVDATSQSSRRSDSCGAKWRRRSMWEATALTGASIAVGTFFGLLAGQLVWRRFTGDLGVRAPVVVPFAALAIAAALLLLVANLLAVVPAYRASRLTASSALRDD